MVHFEGERIRERLLGWAKRQKTKGNGTTLVQISTSLSCLLTLPTLRLSFSHCRSWLQSYVLSIYPIQAHWVLNVDTSALSRSTAPSETLGEAT